MAMNYNSNLTKEIADVGKLQLSRDKIPNEFADKIIPVVDVNPKHSRYVNFMRTLTLLNGTTGTMYTAPLDKDTYLVGAQLSVIKDATATSLISQIAGTLEDGNGFQLLSLNGFTLTAQDKCVSISLNNPIKLQRGSTVRVTNGTNVANVSASAVILGYTVDNANA